MIELLPHVNASLNALATVLLVVGWVLIKRKQEQAHKWTMLTCFGVSVVFLVCYLVYHYYVGSKKFPTYPGNFIRYSYYLLLASHVLLAMAVPVLAVLTIYFGLTNQRQRHVRLARWTFPVWLYVSVTGVMVYLLLYQIFPPLAEKARIEDSNRPIAELRSC